LQENDDDYDATISKIFLSTRIKGALMSISKFFSNEEERESAF